MLDVVCVANAGCHTDHFLLSFLPMSIFGPLSLLVWIYATLYEIVLGREPEYVMA